MLVKPDLLHVVTVYTFNSYILNILDLFSNEHNKQLFINCLSFQFSKAYSNIPFLCINIKAVAKFSLAIYTIKLEYIV